MHHLSSPTHDSSNSSSQHSLSHSPPQINNSVGGKPLPPPIPPAPKKRQNPTESSSIQLNAVSSGGFKVASGIFTTSGRGVVTRHSQGPSTNPFDEDGPNSPSKSLKKKSSTQYNNKGDSSLFQVSPINDFGGVASDNEDFEGHMNLEDLEEFPSLHK